MQLQMWPDEVISTWWIEEWSVDNAHYSQATYNVSDEVQSIIDINRIQYKLKIVFWDDTEIHWIGTQTMFITYKHASKWWEENNLTTEISIIGLFSPSGNLNKRKEADLDKFIEKFSWPWKHFLKDFRIVSFEWTQVKISHEPENWALYTEDLEFFVSEE